jgi:cell division septum initiation protein DivIVA
MDVPAKIEEIEELVRTARAMPMSASCVINRTEMLEHLDELRALLPDELAGAQRVLADSAAVVEEGRAEAGRIVAAARAEAARLISREAVAEAAGAQAEEIISTARADAERMRTEIDDYVDAKLANFEVVLHKTLSAVERGRAKISGRHELDDLAVQPGDDAAAG